MDVSLPFIIAGVGACCGEMVTTPIDCVKTRLQLAARASSSASVVRLLLRDEGVGALYRGLQPALLRQATYGSVRIGLYEPVKVLVSPRDGSAPTLGHKMLAGALCGGAAATLCCPADVVKVRLQAPPPGGPGSAPRYRNVAHAFSTIYAHEGVRGLWSGWSPTAQRAAVVACVELAVYDEAKAVLVDRGFPSDSPVTHIGASIGAAFLSCLAASPADVVKSRLMAQPVDSRGRGLTYSSTLDCVKRSIAGEGALSLWRGFWPAFARTGPHCVVTYTVMEQLRALAASRRS